MPEHMDETLVSNLEDDEYVDYERKGGRNSDYKINVDLPKFYGRMHIVEFLNQITEVENFLEHMEIFQENWVKLVAFKLKGGHPHGGKHMQNRRSYWKANDQTVGQIAEDDGRVFVVSILQAIVVFKISELPTSKSVSMTTQDNFIVYMREII